MIKFYLTFVLGVAAVGCASDGNPAPPAEDSTIPNLPDIEAKCRKEAAAANAEMDDYAAGIARTTGDITVTLTDSDPAPPASGKNTWTARVEKGGQPLPGAELIVYPLMVAHGHSTPAVPVIQDVGDGTYTAQMYFSMTGFWQTTVTVKTGDAQESVKFGFCIE